MASGVSYPSSKQALWVKLANSSGRGLSQLGINVPTLDADRLIDKACKQTGLTDFGEGNYRQNLDLLTRCLEEEANLSLIGRFSAMQMVTQCLRTRLQLIEYRKQRPQVKTQQIVKPIFVMGLPRTGTTILYELLAQDPAHRSPLSWEVAHPIPPAVPNTWRSDPRIMIENKSAANLESLSPGFSAVHELGGDLPQECVSLMASQFASDQWSTSFNIPSYANWLLKRDMSDAYSWHYAFLQHMQVDHSLERWVLKTPVHLAYLDALVAQYPDAYIIQTHRDPMTVIASLASLTCTLQSAFSDRVNAHEIAELDTQRFATMLEQGMKLRKNIEAKDAEAGKQSRFCDIYFRDFIKDPLGAIKDIYKKFNLTLSDEALDNMNSYIASRPRDKRGTHNYQMEDFGLSDRQHGPLFEHYRQEFRV